jgi:maltose phosphorylase
MIQYLKVDPWKVIETGFDAKHHQSSESIFSLGNGKFGHRAGHEEQYSGPHLKGSYVAGVYYPDKTRVGWWKNGYPEYFAKVLNATAWHNIHVSINGEALDLAVTPVREFVRELDMQKGLLSRSFIAEMKNGVHCKIETQRFISMDNESVAAIRMSVTPLNQKATVSFESLLDGNVKNHDANYDEIFWEPIEESIEAGAGCVVNVTKKTQFELAVAMTHQTENVRWVKDASQSSFVSAHFEGEIAVGSSAVIYKYVGLDNSLYVEKGKVKAAASAHAKEAQELGYAALLSNHIAAWAKIWEMADIVIEGSDEAQQGIRFNIFHLNQTYTGSDARLNIGPKGFTGEKYGGSTYWDTEAYCIPFYMATKNQDVAKQLLKYRHNQLDRAIENAGKLGFVNGAALYPMVTMNGEECHNEWEITFEEIHRNGAIAYAIYNYTRYTGDTSYVMETGWEVLLGIARFWAQRVHWSSYKNRFVMHGVTGPNEYENNVNNNWYTNYIAVWCLKYCREVLDALKQHDAGQYAMGMDKWKVSQEELNHWNAVIEKMYFPEHENGKVYLQQDGFLDKVLMSANDLPASERPINQHWSWDRILRSCFIKQADVLQGLYFFEDDFSLETIKANFDFYEPMTVHESSLSPCVHSILAAKLGYEEKAVEMYMRTSRLDLDDYNHEAHEGLHITSMAGTWMSIVQGFGGMRIENDSLTFHGMLPKDWKSFTFRILFRGVIHSVTVDASGTKVVHH